MKEQCELQQANEGKPKEWPKVAIVILNWNGWQDTIECLESLQRITYPNYQVIVVDNGSTDDSVQRIRAWARTEIANHRSVILISKGENLGFSAGNNIGIKKALQDGCEYVLLLNNDTVVEGSFLTNMVKCAEKHKRVGIIGCKIYYTDEPRKIWYAGGRLNVVRPGGKPYGQGQLDHGQYNREREVSFVIGAVMLVKSQLFEDIGLLDERFFFGIEDYDFCRRALKAGYRLLYTPEAVVWHKVGASREWGIVDFYRGYKTSIIYMKKNLPWLVWLPWFSLYSMHALLISPHRARRAMGIIDRKMYRKAILMAIKEGFFDDKIDSDNLKNIRELCR